MDVHTIAEGKEVRWQLQVVAIYHIPLHLHAVTLLIAHMAARYSTANAKHSIYENQAEHSIFCVPLW